MPESTASVPIDELLAHRAWVRALALALARDASEADDLEQETWLAAMRSPPHERSSLRGWLGTVVRRALGRSRREAGRRERREGERDAPQGDLPPEEVVSRAEIHERLVRAVLDLEEPYRTPVLLRYFDGLSHGEIATRTGSTESTVRSRVHRGLDRLRSTLGASHPGGTAAFRVALLRFAESPESGGPAADTPLPRGTARERGPLVAGAAALLLVAGLGVALVWMQRPGGEEAPPVLLADGAAGLAGGVKPVADAASDPPKDSAAAGPTREVANAPARGPAPVRVTLVPRFLDRGGTPLDGDEVRTLMGAGPISASLISAEAYEEGTKETVFGILKHAHGDEHLWRAPLALAPGSAPRFDGSAHPGDWRLVLFLPGRRPWVSPEFSVGEQGVVRIDVPLPAPGIRRRIRVLDADTRVPLAGVMAVPYFSVGRVTYQFGGLGVAGPGVPLDSAGEAEVFLPVEPVEKGCSLGWWVFTEDRSAFVGAERLAEQPEHLPLELLTRRHYRMEGKAYGEDGTPAAGATAVVTSRGWMRKVVVGADGRFALDGLLFPPADHNRPSPGAGETKPAAFIWLAAAGSPADILCGQSHFPVPGGTLVQTLGTPLSSRGTCGIRCVVRAGNQPVHMVGVLVWRRGEGDEPRGQFGKDHQVTHLEPGAYHLTLVLGAVLPSGITPGVHSARGLDFPCIVGRDPVELAAGETRTFEFSLPTGSVEIEVQDADSGAPLSGAQVTALTADPVEKAALESCFAGFLYYPGMAGLTGADGREVLVGLPVGRATSVRVSLDGYETRTLRLEGPEVAESPSRVEVRLQRVK